MMTTIMALAMHTYMTLPISIAVVIFIYSVSLTFSSSLTEIKWSKIGTTIAKQGVTKYKEIIYTLIASRYQ